MSTYRSLRYSTPSRNSTPSYSTPSRSLPSRTRSIRRSLMRSHSILSHNSNHHPHYPMYPSQIASHRPHRRKLPTPARCSDGLPTGGFTVTLPSPLETPQSSLNWAKHGPPPLSPQISAELLEKRRLVAFVNEKMRNPNQESCSHCLLFFPDPFLSLVHSWTHGTAGPYHCDICGQIAPNRAAFVSHIEDPRHMNIAPFQEKAMAALQVYISHTGTLPPSLAQATRMNTNQAGPTTP